MTHKLCYSVPTFHNSQAISDKNNNWTVHINLLTLGNVNKNQYELALPKEGKHKIVS